MELDFPFEPASILRLIRGFINCEDSKDADLPDPETAGMLLWDLSADAETAPGLIELQLLPALSAQLTAFLAGQTSSLLQHRPPCPSTGSPAAVDAPHASTPHAGHSYNPSTIRSRPPTSPARLAEICCGILANLYSIPALVPQLRAHAGLAAAAAALMLELEDPPALSELCRLLTAALSSPEECAVWLPVLLAPHSTMWLLHIISNTLHPQLLERSLLLLAALLAVAAELPEADAAAARSTPHEPVAASTTPPLTDVTDTEQQQQHTEEKQTQSHQDQRPAQMAESVNSKYGTLVVIQQLLQHGLVPALEAVLVPAAAPVVQLQSQLLLQVNSAQQGCTDTGAAPGAVQHCAGPEAAAAAEAAPGSGWSDDDSPRAAAAAAGHDGDGGSTDGGSNGQHANRVYRQPEVLLALLSCLEQLGQQEEVVVLMLQEMQELPQLLLQLMLACRLQEQHEVLELLLPVLVLFRAGVLPLLTVAETSPHADPQQYADGPGKSEQQQNVQGSDLQEFLQCLQCWACVAGVLNDCGCESLDAIDAAWYLLAAAAPSTGALLTGLCNSSSCKHQAALPVWVGQQLQQLCRCVCESVVPESAAAYAKKCVLALHSALEQQQDHRAALQSVLRGCANMLNRYTMQLSM